MNKILIIAVIIIVLVGGYFLLFNKSSTPAADNIASPLSMSSVTTNPKASGVSAELGVKTETGAVNTAKKVTVNYTNSGFSPSTITIKKGDTVVFVNQSSGSMWVASNPHPTHTDYPAFDEKAAVSSGSSWSFTFDKTGSWGYHNHKDPSSLGTIVVE